MIVNKLSEIQYQTLVNELSERIVYALRYILI